MAVEVEGFGEVLAVELPCRFNVEIAVLSCHFASQALLLSGRCGAYGLLFLPRRCGEGQGKQYYYEC